MGSAVFSCSVSFDAAVRRLRRSYASQGLALRRARGLYWRSQCGDWYVIDVRRNYIVHKHVDIHQAAIDQEVLSPGECVAAE
jgi:hypothetical protein